MNGEFGVPGLKNMYLTVAVFLCTLNGWPVNMIRFVMMRVVSVFRKAPMATICGAISLVSYHHEGVYVKFHAIDRVLPTLRI